jgi:hypothetical protein
VKTARQSGFLLLGFTAGALAGTFVWSSVRENYRKELFSRHPLKRFIALSYLSARPTLETVRLLRDYVQWEKRGFLRRQGVRLLHRVEMQLTEEL